MIISLAQGTEGSLDGFLTKNGRSMQARLEGISLYSWVDGCLLAKNPVIMQPSTTLMSDCFLEDQTGICQHMPCPGVGSPHCHICEETTHPGLDGVDFPEPGL